MEGVLCISIPGVHDISNVFVPPYTTLETELCIRFHQNGGRRNDILRHDVGGRVYNIDWGSFGVNGKIDR
jgi:hypothetical protein